jgi:hypothetical protein
MSIEDWTSEYSRTLYLRKLSDAGLQQRFDDITKNLWSTGQSGEVTPPRKAENRQRLLRLLVHYMAEQRRRGRSWPWDSEADIRREASKHYSPPSLKEPFLGQPACFAKFGKRVHLQDSLERGALRISLASTYDDASLNPAQRDDELNHWSRTPNHQFAMSLIGVDETGSEIQLPYQPGEAFRGIRAANFYVWCCAAEYDARLFEDFGSDSVLIIRNQEAFRMRLRQAMSNHLPGTIMVDGRVDYYDPYDVDPSLLRPIFVKQFGYLYQHEYRFAWEVGPGNHPKYLNIQIGSLTDIAELLEMDGSI